MILTIPFRSVYKELHADRETGCSPCGRGSHAKNMGTLLFSVGFGLCQWAFVAYAHLLCSVRYSTFPLTTPFAVWISLFFGRGRGYGGRATEKTSDYRQCSGADFVVEWSGKNPDCQGKRVEILRIQNTTRLDSLDRYSGLILGLYMPILRFD